MNKKKIELLAPAGDLEKLKFALSYGADAVYMGGTALGLRAKAKNFALGEMAKGVDFAHKLGKKVYITANVFAHNEDFNGITQYFKQIEETGADALIISDLGIFEAAREAVNMDIHISTQANCTNYQAARSWYRLGAKRIVLARELSLVEIKEIFDKTSDCRESEAETGLELEVFAHGAMCMAYSGRCLLSNYMTGRDANTGSCAHTCRWKYRLTEETRPNEYFPVYEDDRGAYIFNSKDLCMIEHLDDIINTGVASLKIEGRMKSPYYAASVVKAYRTAIDDFYADPLLYEKNKKQYMNEVRKSSHRGFTTGFFYGKPTADAHQYDDGSYIRDYNFLGVVLDFDSQTHMATIEQRNKFVKGDEVEFLMTKGCGFTQRINNIYYGDTEIDEAPHACQIVKIKTDNAVSVYDIMRKER